MSTLSSRRQPTVDVVIVSYRHPALLETLLAQLRHPSIHTIVVDNCASPQTRLIAEPLAGDYIPLGYNAGFGRATNIGARLGSSEVLAIVNPDVDCSAQTILRGAAELVDRPDVGVLGCRLRMANGEPDRAAKRNIVPPAQALVYLAGRRRGSQHAYHAPEVAEDDEGFVDAVNGAFMIVRRSDFDAVGGFDEVFWMYMEDVDLCLRIREQSGRRTLYWPGVTALHLKSAITGRARTPRLNYHFFRSAWLFYARHQSADDPRLVRLAILAGLVGFGIARTLGDLVSRSVRCARRE